MTLNEAIEIVIRNEGKSMTASEIAEKLNKNKLYSKDDLSIISASQISARVNKCPKQFKIIRLEKPLKIDLSTPNDNVIPKLADITVVKNKPLSKTNIKNSFDAIEHKEIEILILGTLPGDKSIQLGQYYSNPSNYFWKILANIFETELPTTYDKKVNFLLTNKIGIWDVAHSCQREGSLDKNIKDEMPNDIDDFIIKHSKLKTIAFNGQKAQKLFEKYFNKKTDIKYIQLISSSSMSMKSLENLILDWRKILN